MSLQRRISLIALAFLLPAPLAWTAGTVIASATNSIVTIDLATLSSIPIAGCPGLLVGQPGALAPDNQGGIYYVSPGTNTVGYCHAGSNVLVAGSANGVSNPQDLVLDPANSNLYISNFGGNNILKVSLKAAFPNASLFASVSAPRGMAFDNAGNLYVAANYNSPANGVCQLSTTGAVSRCGSNFDQFSEIDRLTYDPSANRLFASSSFSPIYRVDLNTLNGVFLGTVPFPQALANDANGTLYIGSLVGLYTLPEAGFSATAVLSNSPFYGLAFRPPAVPPLATAAFNPRQVPSGGASTLTLNIVNPNSITLNAVAFTDVLPPGVTVAAPPNFSSTCGPLAGVAPGSTSLQLAGGSIPAGGACLFSVNLVDVNPAGTQSQNCITPTSSAGAAATPACDILTVSAPPSGILIPSNLTVSPGQNVPVPISLASPAPSLVLITLSIDDSSKASVFPSPVAIGAGATTVSGRPPQLTGMDLGSATLNASAPGYPPVTSTITVSANLVFPVGPITLFAGRTSRLTLTLSAGVAPARGLTVNLMSSSPNVATVPPAVMFAPGDSTVIVPITPVASGPFTITASGPFLIPASLSGSVQ